MKVSSSPSIIQNFQSSSSEPELIETEDGLMQWHMKQVRSLPYIVQCKLLGHSIIPHISFLRCSVYFHSRCTTVVCCFLCTASCRTEYLKSHSSPFTLDNLRFPDCADVMEGKRERRQILILSTCVKWRRLMLEGATQWKKKVTAEK